MPFVLDASVAVSWLFEDEFSDYANAVLRRLGQDGAIVPAVWPLEVANAVLTAERRGRVSAAETAQAIEISLNLPVAVQEVGLELALRTVLELGRAQRLTAYDAAYLDLAMREGLPLATQDASLRSAAGRVGVRLFDATAR